MKYSKSLIILLPALIICSVACYDSQSAVQSPKVFLEDKSVTTSNTISETSIKNPISVGDEIENCTPEKLYRGDSISVKFNKSHGGYSAIRRIKDDKWFFLYNYTEDNILSYDIDEFKLVSQIEINTETARSFATYRQFDRVNERIFNKTGRYRVMVSHEDFGQDDPPWTGMCEVYYVNEKRKTEN